MDVQESDSEDEGSTAQPPSGSDATDEVEQPPCNGAGPLPSDPPHRRLSIEADEGVVFSVSHTTRPPREGEVDGVHYHFVATADFERMAQEGAFLEWAIYNANRYGTSWASLQEPLDAAPTPPDPIAVPGR